MKKLMVHTIKIAGEDRGRAMHRLFSLLSLPESANRIAVKLNLCDYRRPETGAVSDPLVVAALLGVLRQRYPGAEILLCENDASDTLTANIWGYLGLDKVAARYGARCINLSAEEWVWISIGGLHFNGVEVPKILKDCDLFINHPKLKTHGKTKITCSLKNLFGCYRPKDKGPFHKFLDRAIVDINLALRPDAVVVDADLCVEGNRGPTQGLPKRLGLFIAGEDPVAVDAFCAKLMGFRPRSVGHILKASQAGVGSMAYQLVGDLEGEDLGRYQFEYSRGNFLFMQLARRVVSWSAAG